MIHKIYGNFDNTNQEHLNLLELWKNKNTKYFNNTINTWTIRDPLKRIIARNNNLNWIEFFNTDEFDNWFQNQ